MKKSIIFAALLLSACTPPLMSDPNGKKTTPETTTPAVQTPAPSTNDVEQFPEMTLEGEFHDDEIGQEHLYEEIPLPEEEII